ncbi:MAG: RelA/SpoT family protein [Bacteroidales bacterium]|nr:RelA/SpoT family protein [Bacteroidales bacterium]MDD4713631.1 RelA/SpoT family protein [Bacteroidales bacterium]
MEDLSTFSQAENDMINEKFQELLQDYMNSNHRQKVEIITKAFHFANNAHKGIKRRSGEPYIMHPIAVAKICCTEIGLGSTSICSALLHDVVEDTEYTIEDIEKNFGSKIASIVDGLTKISGGIFGEQASEQAENFRKLLLTMAEDIRVVLIKMADRLHNMRTLGVMLPSKQYKISGETMYLYAPLANRLGLNRIKTELENLSFKYEHPDTYAELSKKIENTAAARNELYEKFTAPVKEKLDAMGLNYRLKARTKSIYSIWNKMQTKGLPFEEIYDILAVRIIFNTVANEPEPTVYAEEKKKCWDIYSVITDIYKHHPDRIRDWVSSPKANGYQALHVTVMGPDGEWIEVQIRSTRMDEIAERGFAAHWKYKTGEIEEETELNRWIYTIKEILENPEPNAIDFLDTIKMNLFSSEIFVFTPKGEIKTMAAGSTALDFAFELHTEIGFHCIGAKVNHKLVPMSHILKSGDQVEILTSKSQTPKYEWLNYVTTGRAQTRIRAKFRKENKTYIKKGENTLVQFFTSLRIPGDPVNIEKLQEHFGCVSKDDMLMKIGMGELSFGEAETQLFTSTTAKDENKLIKYWKLTFGIGGNKQPRQESAPIEKGTIDFKSTHILTEDSIQQKYRLAECCQPIPGDDVLGYVDENGNISVHKRRCPVAMKLKSSYGPRIISAEWATHKKMSFPVELELRGIDAVGVVSKITKIVSDELAVNMTKLLFETKDGIFKGSIGLFVHDVEDIQNLCMKIAKIKNVQLVHRKEQMNE